MTAQLCTMCQQPLPRPRVLCQCGHPVTSHNVTRAGALTWCSHYSPAGPCGCQAFTEPDRLAADRPPALAP